MIQFMLGVMVGMVIGAGSLWLGHSSSNAERAIEEINQPSRPVPVAPQQYERSVSA